MPVLNFPHLAWYILKKLSLLSECPLFQTLYLSVPHLLSFQILQSCTWSWYFPLLRCRQPTLILCHRWCSNHMSIVLAWREYFLYSLVWYRYPEFPVYLFNWLLTLLYWTIHKERSWTGISWPYTFIPLSYYMWNSYPRRSYLVLNVSWSWSSSDFWRNSLLWCHLICSRSILL